MAPLLLAMALALPLTAADLPPGVEAILPSLKSAEKQLQVSTLDLEAARREAEPAQAEVTAARVRAESWWGQWELRRKLAVLKERLDKVEAARSSQAQARQSVFTVLTGLDEEMRAALESALRKGEARRQAPRMAAWWKQQRSWTRRLEALESGAEEKVREASPDSRSLLIDARLEQLERDQRLLEGLAGIKALGPEELAAQRKDLLRARQSWSRRRRPAKP